MSDFIAQLDIANMTADQKLFNNYNIPKIMEGRKLFIKNGRHPVVEQALPLASDYTPNDCQLNDGNIWLITGPNMAGKSTFLRQNAIIIILAQTGLFVPAEKAEMGLVDKIFSRVGASDNLSQGQSTFMVEMIETASILNRATEKSFIIFDEVGRGTSTYDGLAIAWSILEYLLEKLKAKVLFATHYHELTSLNKKSRQIKNHKMEIKEWNNEIIFLYKIVQGEANKSYGLEVAKLAGLPDDLIFKANEILNSFEQKNYSKDLKLSNCSNKEKNELLVESFINNLDLNKMTPLKALETLFDIQKLSKSKINNKC
jgi:DNA mismatch repair protein MutS